MNDVTRRKLAEQELRVSEEKLRSLYDLSPLGIALSDSEGRFLQTNQAMEIIRPAGAIGVPGLYVTEDPGARDAAAKTGSLSLRLGLGWSKSNSFHTGQTPVLRDSRQLIMALLADRLPIAKIVNAQAIDLEDAPKGYAEFDKGVAAKFVLDPHGLLPKAA